MALVQPTQSHNFDNSGDVIEPEYPDNYNSYDDSNDKEEGEEGYSSDDGEGEMEKPEVEYDKPDEPWKNVDMYEYSNSDTDG